MKTHCPILSELHPRVRSSGQQGFTLIGLLVVIAIIGILTWLLLPALEQAKVKAKAIAYMNSVRQVDIATKLYINDNNDHFACTFTLEGGEDDQLNSAAGNWGGTAPRHSGHSSTAMVDGHVELLKPGLWYWAGAPGLRPDKRCSLAGIRKSE